MLALAGFALVPVTAGLAQSPPSPPTSVEDRLGKLEEANRQLAEQNRKLLERFDDLSRRYDAIARPPTPPAPAPSAGDGSASGGTSAAESATPDPGMLPLGRGAGQQPMPRRARLRADVGPGFQLETDDEEFQLQIHNMTAVEERAFTDANRTPYHSGLFLARERWYINGRITKGIEYYTVVNRSYSNNFDILDAFINFNYDPRLQFKVGRYRVPFSYEWYANPIQYLLQPERSLFAVNFGMNRQFGAQVWGQLADKRVDYAVGLFNGPRNSFEDFNSAKDVMAFLNVRPFGQSAAHPWLKFLNLGGSVDFGNQNNPLFAQNLRTSINGTNAATAAAASPTFLAFNNGVTETGDRAFWSMHLAYFYKHLSLIAEWESGFEGYGLAGRRARVPVQGYYVQAGYFLTGETVEGRNAVKPLKPFSLRKGKEGLGAIELAARWSSLDLGGRVFTAGLADPNLWTDRLGMIDLGWNWYLNQYLKVYFGWEHALYATPVLTAPNRLEKSNDMFWIRALLYF